MRGASGGSDSDERGSGKPQAVYAIFAFGIPIRSPQHAECRHRKTQCPLAGDLAEFKGNRFKDRNELEPHNYNVGNFKR